MGAQPIKLDHQFPAQPVQLADREDDLAFKKSGEPVEPVGRAAEAAELFPQAFGGEGLRLGRFQRNQRIHFDHVPGAIAHDHRQGRPRAAVRLDRDRPLEPDLVALKRLADAFLQRRIAGLPDAIPHVHPPEVDVALAKAQHGFRAVRFDLVDPAALLLVLRLPGVEHQSVAGLKRRDQAKRHAVRSDACHLAQEDTALRAEVRVNELLVVRATEPPGVETPRKSHGHRVVMFAMERGQIGAHGFLLSRGGMLTEFRRGRKVGRARGHQPVHRLPVGPRDGRDVFGAFQAPLDLERGDAQADEFRKHVEGGEILRAQ